jgi:hypothetical protein
MTPPHADTGAHSNRNDSLPWMIRCLLEDRVCGEDFAGPFILARNLGQGMFFFASNVRGCSKKQRFVQLYVLMYNTYIYRWGGVINIFLRL